MDFKEAMAGTMQELGINQSQLDEGDFKPEQPEMDSDEKPSLESKEVEQAENAVEQSDEVAKDESELADSKEQSDKDDKSNGEEFHEIEFNGKKYEVPLELKDAFFRQDDYTRKTQALAEDRKVYEQNLTAFNEQVTQLEQNVQKHKEALSEYEELNSFITNLQTNDPDQFAEIQRSFLGYRERYDNPAVRKLMDEVHSLRQAVNETKGTFTQKEILADHELGMNKLESTFIKEAKQYGVPVSIEAIENKWANTPGLTHEEAFKLLYGDKLAAAKISKTKVSEARKIVQSKPGVKTTGSMSGTNGKQNIDFKKMSTEQIARYYAGQV
jgi:hypothetical protein